MTDPVQPDPTEPAPPGPEPADPAAPDPEDAGAAHLEALRRRPFPEVPLAQIPIAAIDANALLRDRTREDEPALLELRLSIARSGLRMPIEVYPLPEPCPPFTHGLISGFRRLAAFRGLHEFTRQDKYATIPAFLRSPEDLAEAMTAMVEENAIRVELSPWEQAMIAVRAARCEAYPGIDAAIAAFYGNLNRQKRARIRAVAEVANELDGWFTAPETLSLRQLLRLSPLIPRGYGDLLRATLADARNDTDAEWRALLPILHEAETPEPEAPPRPGRPRRTLELRSRGLRIRRERTRTGWALIFSGRDATSDMLDCVFDEIERLFSPPEPRDLSKHLPPAHRRPG